MDRKENVIELTGVTLRRGKKNILNGVDLEVRRGQCCVVLGPNGSGKSTLMAVIAGYIWPSEGRVNVFGEQFGKVNLAKVRQRIGLIEPSRMPRFDSTMNVRELVATGVFGTMMLFNQTLTLEQETTINEAMSLVGLGLDNGKLMLGQLSTGEQMKAYLARAMVSKPELLILDEPTVGLDIGARASIVKMLGRFLQGSNGRTLIIVSHHLDELPAGVDKVVLMKQGKILLQGTSSEVLTKAHMSEAFGCDLDIVQSNGRYMAFAKD